MYALGLYLTTTCNRRCTFCFKKHDYPKPTQISREDLETLCAWSRENDVEEFIVAGGEPTTHPDFVPHIQTLQRRLPLSGPLRIITNLMCDEAKLAAFNHVRVLANASSLDQYSPTDLTHFRHNLRAITSRQNRVALSFTINRLEQPDDHLLPYCVDFGIKQVRLDIARASILAPNQYVTLEQLPAFKTKITALAGRLVAGGIKINFDCPLPYDLFTTEELHALGDPRIIRMDPTRNTCDNLYINPDLTISACPHQRVLEQRLDSFETYVDLQNAVGQAKHRKLLDRLYELRKEDRADEMTSPCLCEAERFISRAGRSRTGTTPAPEAGGLPSSPQPE